MKEVWRNWLRSPICSWRGLLLRAVELPTLFAVAHLCGLAEYTTFLSGNIASLEVSRTVAQVLGSTYLVFYLLAVLVAPVLLLGSGLLAAATRLVASRRPG
jgi:hypothetical protein